MKIWYQHGSEHSANLVMIGHFKSAVEATKAKEIIDALTRQVSEDQANGTLIEGRPSDRYGDTMLDLIGRLGVVAIAPQELEQFAYDVRAEVKGDKLVLTTDEFDISAYLKVLISVEARIEIYSAHHHPDTPHGRGR